MKLEEPVQLASCGPMDYGHQIGRQSNHGHQIKQPNALSDRSEPSQLSAQDKTQDLDNGQAGNTSRLVIDLAEKTNGLRRMNQRSKLRVKRHMAPNLRQSRKHRLGEHQQQPQVLPGSQNVSHDANLLLQHHITNLNNHLAATTRAAHAFTTNTSGGRLDRAPTPADLSSTSTNTNISNTNNSSIASSVSGLLSDCFRYQDTNTSHHQQHCHQAQPPAQPAGIDFMSSRAAMEAQAVRQQDQRRQEILDQFSNLHSLSAVATAIQQSHHLDLSQSSSFITQQQHLTMNHQFDLSRLQHHSKQLQFSLANLTLNNGHPVASVPSSLASSTSMQSVPMDLHRQRRQQQQHLITDNGLNGNQNTAHSTLMSMVRDSLVTRLTPLSLAGAAIGQHQANSFVNFSATNQKTHSSYPGGVHQRVGAGSASGASGGIRIGRRRGSRKCRKIYGMAQRQLWCTQCKWKKACSRFFYANQSNQAGLMHSASSSVAAASAGVCCTPMAQFRQNAVTKSGSGIR